MERNQTGKQSIHYKASEAQRKREKNIQEELHGNGQTVKSFVIDKGHKNGKEIHTITDHGVILIQNKKTGMLITKLIAKPSQIRKYYAMLDMDAPEWLLKIAKRNRSRNLNK